MDKMRRSSDVSSIDDVVHSHTLEKYKLFVLPSQRNSLLFTDKYDNKIIIYQIEEKINFLKNVKKESRNDGIFIY